MTTLNTVRPADGSYGRRGRRVEYSAGWPVDARTQAAIEGCASRTGAPLCARTANPTPTPASTPPATHRPGQGQVADLAGLLRHAVIDGQVDVDLLEGWPDDLRVIASRTPRQPGEQAEPGHDANLRYGAFATNTATGQVQ